MDVGMIVGEAMPLAWERWRHICRLVERLGFHSLFRSDHYFNGSQKDALDVFLSFVMGAEETERVRLGPLVSPITFREPVNIGRMAQQLDALSNGRFVLGLGAGWHAEEHRVYGLPFPPRPERYDRLTEALQLLNVLWYSERGSFDGTYYHLDGADSRPHPPPGRPPILIGGNGPTRTLRLVAEYADEWNATPLDPAAYRQVCRTLEQHCEEVDRDPTDIRRSMLIFATIGPDNRSRELALERYLAMISPEGSTTSLTTAEADGTAPWRGSVAQLVDHVGLLAEAGLDEVIFDHLCHDEDTIPEWLAAEVMPQLQRL